MIVSKRLNVLAIGIIVLLGCIATSLTSYFFAKQSVYEHVSEQILPLSSDNIYSEIQRDLLQPTLISSLMAHDSFVHDWYLEGEKTPDQMVNYLKNIQTKYDTITAFFVSEQTRKYYHSSGVLKTVSESDVHDAWYFEAKSSSLPNVINIDSDTADAERITVFVNYRVIDNSGAFLGVIGVGLSMNLVDSLIEYFDARYGRNVYFIDRSGEVMFNGAHQHDLSFRETNKASFEQAFSSMVTADSSSVSFNAPQGKTVFLNSRYIPEFNWYLIVEQVEDGDTEEVERALIINLVLSGVVSLCILAFVHWVTRGYSNKLERMARYDHLTGAVNRQTLDVLFQKAIGSSNKKQEALSLVLIDIDHFKKVNDNFGHQAGDKVISGVARIMKNLLHKEDIICRWGGEEFLFILSNTDKSKATSLIKTLLNRIEDTNFDVGESTVSITISAGLTQLNTDESLPQAIARADARLYQAKKEGRNTFRSG
ncbi:sensor domain-containing diguanylate cyclase [Marinomonas mediterranea]|uniref:sensor domain-containing diguanylate cyclase n=1 Tax=Marinomonas mediterranea TaxID=119864 RepID=UPI002349C132|nr:sensor domain-containing diguanylate cyclase [Marinomonas mediterranea]WCN09816.1 diguanylate cyclase [Marinomonas mediterranea]